MHPWILIKRQVVIPFKRWRIWSWMKGAGHFISILIKYHPLKIIYCYNLLPLEDCISTSFPDYCQTCCLRASICYSAPRNIQFIRVKKSLLFFSWVKKPIPLAVNVIFNLFIYYISSDKFISSKTDGEIQAGEWSFSHRTDPAAIEACWILVLTSLGAEAKD